MKKKKVSYDIPSVVLSSILYIGFCYAIGLVFFRDYVYAVALLPMAVYMITKCIRNHKAKRKRLLLERFRLFIGYLNAGMQGTSKPIEKAFSEAVSEMEQLYSRKDVFLSSMITIQRTLCNNQSKLLEKEFLDFAVHTGVTDIIDFANVLFSCKNTNASAISKVINLTDELISEKLSAQMDFNAVVQENRMVFNIMSLMPTAFILFFNASMQGYLDPLYSGTGRIVMIIGVVMNGLSYIMGNSFIERYDAQ